MGSEPKLVSVQPRDEYSLVALAEAYEVPALVALAIVHSILLHTRLPQPGSSSLFKKVEEMR